MVGHGWGGTGEAANGSPAPYTDAGYNVLTWDARGFGGSGGTVMIDHPEFEGRDVAGADRLHRRAARGAARPPGDPRLGMAGGSYGGGIQLVTAARDKRVDAIAPTIAWHSLLEPLPAPNRSRRAGTWRWSGVGIPTSIAPGIFSPAGVQTGHQPTQFYDAVIERLATGQIQRAEQPGSRSTAPTSCWRDPDADPDHPGHRRHALHARRGHRNYRALRDNGMPLKMMWFCGGHGVCNVDRTAPAARSRDSAARPRAPLAWFDRYLKGDQRHAHRARRSSGSTRTASGTRAGGYPLEHAGQLEGSGDGGTLPLTPGHQPASASRLRQPRSPAPITVAIRRRSASTSRRRAEAQLTYTATGASPPAPTATTHIYAQIVDQERNLVVNNLATPIPIELDGAEHEIALSSSGSPAAAPRPATSCSIGQTNVYDFQRAAGPVRSQTSRCGCRSRAAAAARRNPLAEAPLGLVGRLGERHDDPPNLEAVVDFRRTGPPRSGRRPPGG